MNRDENRNAWLTRMNCGGNFAYVLEQQNSFVPMQYKVMRNQTSDFLLPCSRMLYNGKVQLYFQTKGKKPLSEQLAAAQGDGIFLLLLETLRAVSQLQAVGFLRGENVNLSYDSIYVDAATKKVSLVYLPCAHGFFDSAAAMENELRTGFVKLINDLPERTERLSALAAALMDGTRSLGEVLAGMAAKPLPRRPGAKRQMLLRSLDLPRELVIPITKDRFLIGRDPETDYVVTFNDRIGRKHCRIDVNDEKFFVYDLNSTNHTFLNQKQLKTGLEYPLKHGDVLSLADSRFRVVIE